MHDLDLAPAIRYTLALAADPDIAPELLKPALREFDTPTTCAALANATATAIAERTPIQPRQKGPLSTAEVMALVLVSKARHAPEQIPDDLAGLTPDRLSAVTIALLTIWRMVCAAHTQAWTEALTPTQQPWEALLSPENGADGSEHQ